MNYRETGCANVFGDDSYQRPAGHLVTAPATDAAKQWDGWGTALKPAWEPIILARKPLAGTVAANVQEHGTGALNINACRIPIDGNEPDSGAMFYAKRNLLMPKNRQNYFGGKNSKVQCKPINGGRWPANVVLDEAAAAMLDEQSGELTSGVNPAKRGSDKFRQAYGTFVGERKCVVHRGQDIGGASRFFYCAKASRAERNIGDADNTHPTVKPLSLMDWLCRLVTPPNGLMLDPFMGSGTTLVAAKNLNRKAIGIEIEERYCEIAAQRLSQTVLDLS
jgi:site-specific DNA-methyltransferase (adenine-specific)